MLGNPIAGGAEEVVADEVATMAEHDKIVRPFGGYTGNEVRRVTGSHFDIDFESRVRGLAAGSRCEPREELVLSLDRERGQLRAHQGGKLRLYLLEQSSQLVEAIGSEERLGGGLTPLQPCSL